MKKSNLYFACSLLFVALLSSCTKDKSEVVTQDFKLNNFTSIALSMSADVTIKTGETQMVEVTGPEKTVNKIEKEVKNGAWDIRLPNGYNKSYDDLQIIITSDAIEELTISGSGNIMAGDSLNISAVTISGSGNIDCVTKASSFNSSISGSGDIDVSGKTGKVGCSISGSGNFNSYSLSADEADVSISGSGNARVRADSTLGINISGSGNVRYRGNPGVSVSISGSGQVIDDN